MWISVKRPRSNVSEMDLKTCKFGQQNYFLIKSLWSYTIPYWVTLSCDISISITKALSFWSLQRSSSWARWIVCLFLCFCGFFFIFLSSFSNRCFSFSLKFQPLILWTFSSSLQYLPSPILLEPAIDSVSLCLSLVELCEVFGGSIAESNHLDRDEKLTMISVFSRLSTTETWS